MECSNELWDIIGATDEDIEMATYKCEPPLLTEAELEDHSVAEVDFPPSNLDEWQDVPSDQAPIITIDRARKLMW